MPPSLHSLSRVPLFRLLAINCLAGIGLGIAFTAGLVMLDAHGLGSLILRSESGVIALALLAGGLSLTFASVMMGTAIMLSGKRDDEDRDASSAPEVEEPALALATVRARRG
jgi:hypothetical protein